MAAAAVMAAGHASAENLFLGGDFTEAKQGLGMLAFANGGKASLHRENGSWNACACLEVLAPSTNAEGVVLWNAVLVVGSDGKSRGVPVKEGRTYDFSLELRGDRELPAGVTAYCWGTNGLWKGSSTVKTTLGRGVMLREGWTLYKGSFKAPKGATRAGLQLQLWASTKFPPVRLKTGDRLYADNVVIEEAEDGFAALAGGGAKKAATVKRVKTVADGVDFSDFFTFTRGAGAKGAAANPPTAQVRAAADGFEVSVSAEDPKGVAAGNATSAWSGMCVEVFFGPVADNVDRKMTQFAWNPSGARFSQKTGGKIPVDSWSVAESRVEGNVWRTVAKIPYATLGWNRTPRKGEQIAFNLCVNRKDDAVCWAPVTTGFGDVAHFGRLVAGSYNEALALVYGGDGKVSGRDAYEELVAAKETAARQAEIDRFAQAGFTVSVVPVDSDYSVPFVPREAFRPPSNIVVKAAVNEETGVPVAILNVTDRFETYVVRLETSTANPAKPYAEKQYNGTWGLKGFPADRVVAREALRMKDSDNEPVTLRLEQLPRMNEACTITVPPREAGVVWFDFNTADVAPGRYEGRVRVIPLGAASKWKPYKGVAYHERDYIGKMQDVPFALEVLPIELSKEPAMPAGFFQNATSEGQFDLMWRLGTRDFQVSPWSFQWERTADGAGFDYARPKPDKLEHAEGNVREMIAWARKRGFRPTFFVGFSAFGTFRNVNGFRKDFEGALRLWPAYVQGVKRFFNGLGVNDGEYAIEVYDEPDPGWCGDMKRVLAAARAAAPGVKLLMTLGAHGLSAAQMRELAPYVDAWVLWSHGYFAREEHLAFVKETLAAGKEVWHYTCSTSGRAPIYETYRLHPWFGWRHGLTGNQFYIFQEMTGGYGLADFKCAMSAGFAYRSFDSTMPGLRYMSMRRGMTDIKYLARLKEVAGEVPEVKAFLADAPVAVVSRERHDKTTPDRMREEAVRLLLKYH